MADDQAIIAMVESGLGVSIIPEMVLEGLSYNININRLELDPVQHRSIAIAALSLKDVSPATKRFTEFSRESNKEDISR